MEPAVPRIRDIAPQARLEFREVEIDKVVLDLHAMALAHKDISKDIALLVERGKADREAIAEFKVTHRLQATQIQAMEVVVHTTVATASDNIAQLGVRIGELVKHMDSMAKDIAPLRAMRIKYPAFIAGAVMAAHAAGWVLTH